MIEETDFLIIGAGIAGASIGYWLAPHGRVTLLERESQPGYHATGRSAALFMQSYGTPQVCALSKASRDFLQQPPAGFCEHALLSPRGALIVASPGQETELAEHWESIHNITPAARLLDRASTCAMLPVLHADKVLGAIFGAVKALILAILLHMLLTTFLPPDAPILRQGQLCPYLSQALTWSQQMIKDDKVRQAFQKKMPAIPDQVKAHPAVPLLKPAAPAASPEESPPVKNSPVEPAPVKPLPAVQ